MSTALLLLARTRDLVLAGPVGSLDAYVDRVPRIPVLSRKKSSRSRAATSRQRRFDAARQLVLSHLRFVVHIARGYTRLWIAGRRSDPGR